MVAFSIFKGFGDFFFVLTFFSQPHPTTSLQITVFSSCFVCRFTQDYYVQGTMNSVTITNESTNIMFMKDQMLERDRLGEETISRGYLESTSTKQSLSSLRVQKTHEVKTNSQGEQLRKTLFSSSLLSSRPNTITAFC